MAFTSAEVWRIKAELGYNVLSNGAEPYISIVALFDQVVNANIAAAVSTTATLATPISAGAPSPQTLTLASAVGFAVGNRVGVDVDGRYETPTISNLSGNNITVLLSNAHSGTIPVTLDGPILMAREALTRIASVKSELASTFGYGALKAVDEVQFYDHGGTQFGSLGDQLNWWRDELASYLGVPNMWRRKQRAGGSMSVY
jgi:hypothetical protein